MCQNITWLMATKHSQFTNMLNHRTMVSEHFGSLALPVGEFLALEHGLEYWGVQDHEAVKVQLTLLLAVVLRLLAFCAGTDSAEHHISATQL